MEAVIDLAHVVSNGVDAQSKSIGATLVAVAFGEELQDVELAGRDLEVDLARRRSLTESQDDSARNAGRHRRAAGAQLFDAFQQADRLGFLEQVTAKTISRTCGSAL